MNRSDIGLYDIPGNVPRSCWCGPGAVSTSYSSHSLTWFEWWVHCGLIEEMTAPTARRDEGYAKLEAEVANMAESCFRMRTSAGGRESWYEWKSFWQHYSNIISPATSIPTLSTPVDCIEMIMIERWGISTALRRRKSILIQLTEIQSVVTNNDAVALEQKLSDRKVNIGHNCWSPLQWGSCKRDPFSNVITILWWWELRIVYLLCFPLLSFILLGLCPLWSQDGFLFLLWIFPKAISWRYHKMSHEAHNSFFGAWLGLGFMGISRLITVKPSPWARQSTYRSTTSTFINHTYLWLTMFFSFPQSSTLLHVNDRRR